MGRKVSETRPLLSHERSTKHQILPTELEPGTGGLEAHDLATVTLKTNTDVSCAAELRLTSSVPGRTLGGRWGRVDPWPEMADTDRKTSLEDARGLSSRRDDCAAFDLTAASSARPRPQSSPPQTPAPSRLPTGRKKDCTSRSPPPRSCLQLRRRGWGGVGWGAPQLPPRDPERQLRASGPAPGSRLPALRTLLACGRRASLRFLTSSMIAVPGFGCVHNPPGEGEEENCNELRGTVSVPGSPATRGVRFQECSLHQALSTSMLCSGRGLCLRLSLALLTVRGTKMQGGEGNLQVSQPSECPLSFAQLHTNAL